MNKKADEIKALESTIMHEIECKDKQKLKALAQEVKSKIEESIKKLNYKADVVIGGSFAKGTFTKNPDIDIFVRFDKTYKNEELSNHLERILKQDFKVTRLHGSRDYFQIFLDVKIEVLPVYKIKKTSEAENLTDFSPFHVTWFNSKANEEIRRCVKVSKALFKANRIYGAESYKQGISGFVIEILSVNYGNFYNLIKAISQWNEQEIIDVENHYNNKEDVMKSLNETKISPLIVIDPIDKTRNASKALSKRNYDKLRRLAKAFISNPSKEFFKKKDIFSYSGIFLEIRNSEGKEDVVGSKILKTILKLIQFLKEKEFIVKDYEWEWDKKKAVVWLSVNQTLEKEKVVIGPPLTLKKNVEAFRKNHKNVKEKDGRVYAIEKREFTNVNDAINDFILNSEKEKYIKEIKLIER